MPLFRDGRGCGSAILTRRMTLARDQLRTGESTLAQIAARTGYASPYAFAAAFRRHHGRPPGQWRQRELGRTAINQAALVDDIHT